MCGLAAYTFFMAQTDEIYRDLQICACLPQYMKSRRLVERTLPKTRRLELVSHGTPSPDLATNTQTLQAAIVSIAVVLGSYKPRQKTSFGKSKGRYFLSVATLSSLPFQQFLVSRGGFTCCHAGLLGHRPRAEAGVITAQRRNKTSNLQAWQNSSPETCSPRESVEILMQTAKLRVKPSARDPRFKEYFAFKVFRWEISPTFLGLKNHPILFWWSKVDSSLRRSLFKSIDGIRSRDCTSPFGFIANKAVPTEGPDPASDLCGLDPNPGHVS